MNKKYLFFCLGFIVIATLGCNTSTAVPPTPTLTPTPDWWSLYDVRFEWNDITPETLGLNSFLIKEKFGNETDGRIPVDDIGVDASVNPVELDMGYPEDWGDLAPRWILAPGLDPRLITQPAPDLLGGGVLLRGMHYSDGIHDVYVVEEIGK